MENVSLLPDDKRNTINANVIRNVITAIEELMTINIKSNFILEEKPTKEHKKNKKILRSHQRPRYTILSPKEIRIKMQISEPQIESGNVRKSPKPHERRRHYRRLSAEGGHFKESKVIVIPAMWIGESEKKIGNKIYKVRLDV